MTREVTALAENFRRQESDNRATNEGLLLVLFIRGNAKNTDA